MYPQKPCFSKGKRRMLPKWLPKHLVSDIFKGSWSQDQSGFSKGSGNNKTRFCIYHWMPAGLLTSLAGLFCLRFKRRQILLQRAITLQTLSQSSHCWPLTSGKWAKCQELSAISLIWAKESQQSSEISPALVLAGISRIMFVILLPVLQKKKIASGNNEALLYFLPWKTPIMANTVQPKKW